MSKLIRDKIQEVRNPRPRPIEGGGPGYGPVYVRQMDENTMLLLEIMEMINDELERLQNQTFD